METHANIFGRDLNYMDIYSLCFDTLPYIHVMLLTVSLHYMVVKVSRQVGDP